LHFLCRLAQVSGYNLQSASYAYVPQLSAYVMFNTPGALHPRLPCGEWHWDAKIYSLFEGTSEIQRLVMSRQWRDGMKRARFGWLPGLSPWSPSRSEPREPCTITESIDP
jgi:hypothetical protein